MTGSVSFHIVSSQVIGVCQSNWDAPNIIQPQAGSAQLLALKRTLTLQK